jgi:hypothetical protein
MDNLCETLLFCVGRRHLRPEHAHDHIVDGQVCCVGALQQTIAIVVFGVILQSSGSPILVSTYLSHIHHKTTTGHFRRLGQFYVSLTAFNV